MERNGEDLVRPLSVMTFLQWLGASVMLPLLPIYLHRRGASDATVGLVIASFFAAGVVFQYPAGWLADRIGRRAVLLGGLALFGVASIGFAFPVSPFVYLLLRFVQGAGAGAAQVAALAIIASTVPLERRGRAFGSIYGSQLAGMAVGPLIGSAVGAASITAVFAVGGLTSLLACLPVFARRDIPTSPAAPERAPTTIAERGAGLARRALIGSLITAAIFGLPIGVYESCWTLLLTSNGASSWQIGISWTLFALPFVLMARPGGWLADHLDRRHLVIGAVSISLACCATYPFLQPLALVIGMATFEALAIAVAMPAVQSLLSQASSQSRLGRSQGLFSTSETATTALAAGVSGSLFAAATWLPFVACAAAGGVLVLFLPFVWAPVVGRVPPIRIGAEQAA
jgi:DHA1 family multidrug resistance protein-like MFS transporter